MSGKFSSTEKPLCTNFHLHQDDRGTKIEGETPVNARKPSPADVSFLCSATALSATGF